MKFICSRMCLQNVLTDIFVLQLEFPPVLLLNTVARAQQVRKQRLQQQNDSQGSSTFPTVLALAISVYIERVSCFSARSKDFVKDVGQVCVFAYCTLHQMSPKGQIQI